MPFAPRARIALAMIPLVLGAGTTRAQESAPSADSVLALVRAAADHLGGLAALSGIRTVRLEYVTHWYRPSFAPTVSGIANAGSLEFNVDTRDYSRPAWRQLRGGRPTATPAPGITNLVVDSVAIAITPRGELPLNATYLAERDEVFLQAPERLLPLLDSLARHGGTLTRRDTVIADVPLIGLGATFGARETTLWLDRSAFVVGIRVRAAQPLDFGLAAYGVMNVDAWFSQWRGANGVMFPGHIRIRRAGEPYKELFVQAIAVNPTVPADSFAVSDSARAGFAASGARAMFDVPIPPARPDTLGIVTFGPPQVMQGAVRLRDGWLFVGAGADSLVMRRAVEATGAVRGAVIVPSTTAAAAGGAPAAERLGLDVLVPAGTMGLVRAIYRQQGLPMRRVVGIDEGAWQVIAGDSVWVEPVAVPDVPGATLIWVPRLHWAYLSVGAGVMQTRAALALLERRGFQAAHLGTVRAMSRPAMEVRREAGWGGRP